MGNILRALFGRGGSSHVSQHDKAVLDLKVQRDQLKQYQKKIEKVMEREVEVARQLMRDKKKERAKLALKKKKYQETLLAKTDAQLDNVHRMVQEIEFSQVELKVFEELKQGTQALKTIQKEMKVEDVERLMEESREAMEYQDEISKLLSENLSMENIQEANEELEQLELEILSEGMHEVPKTELPKVEEKDIVADVEEEEEEVEDRVAVLA